MIIPISFNSSYRKFKFKIVTVFSLNYCYIVIVISLLEIITSTEKPAILYVTQIFDELRLK